MSKTKIKPILHWEPRGYGLFLGHLCLVSIEKVERNGTPYYKLDHTVAVFQGMKPNSRIASFSLDETDNLTSNGNEETSHVK